MTRSPVSDLTRVSTAGEGASRSPIGRPGLPTAFRPQPPAAVGAAELGERHVVRAARGRSGHPRTVGDVLHLADLDAPGGQLVAGSKDVGNNEQSLLGAALGGDP